jgi:hypothetical protein
MRVDINELLLHGDIPTILVVTLESISWHIAKLMHIDKTNLPPPPPPPQFNGVNNAETKFWEITMTQSQH